MTIPANQRPTSRFHQPESIIGAAPPKISQSTSDSAATKAFNAVHDGLELMPPQLPRCPSALHTWIRPSITSPSTTSSSPTPLRSCTRSIQMPPPSRDDPLPRGVYNSHSDLSPNPEQPSFFWRSTSHQALLLVGAAARFFLYGLNNTTVNGLPRFLDLLKSRSDYKTRQRGLLTVSNHIAVLDDPVIWGVLPMSFHAYHGYMNHRWSFGSHDICFKSNPRSHFFTLGQVLPTHRSAHSPHGGPFQATMTEGIRLLSKISTDKPSLRFFDSPRRPGNSYIPSWPRDIVDPFSDLSPAPSYPSYPSDVRWYHSPSRYASNSYSWVHIFPEGMIHQTPDDAYTMRYFKWGVARLILEPPECPDVVPMFIEGTDQVMHESRTFPRFLPRIGKNITVTFGKELDMEATFGDLRKRWRELRDADTKAQGIIPSSEQDSWHELARGVVTESLAYHPDAISLRIECTRRIRDAVLEVRRSRGYPDEDPKNGVVETWMREGPKREGKMEDGSWVKDA